MISSTCELSIGFFFSLKFFRLDEVLVWLAKYSFVKRPLISLLMNCWHDEASRKHLSENEGFIGQAL